MSTVIDLAKKRAERAKAFAEGYVEDGRVVVEFPCGSRLRLRPAAAETFANGLLELAASARAEGGEP